MIKLQTIAKRTIRIVPKWPKNLHLLCLALLFSFNAFGNISTQEDTTSEKTSENSYYIEAFDEPSAQTPKKNRHHLLAGAKLGVVYVFGVELNYIWRHKERKITYLAASGQTSIVLNSINGGGGFFITGWGLGAGFRYHHLIRLYEEGDKVFLPGYAPEIVWYKEMGPQKNWYINMKAGIILNRDQKWPDISFGMFLPLSK
jgi:hypothetical protein